MFEYMRKLSKDEKHFARCFERKLCNLSSIDSGKKIKLIDWYMKIDPPMWVDANFECMNQPVDDPQQKTFLQKKT